jgi:ParB family chromosome partitioning protein
MALGNKGFAGLITGGGGGGVEPRRPPRTGILGVRENRLAELSSGGAVTRVHEQVDPAVCRIWDGHNRDYAALNEVACSDLIESLRAQGRQEVPAIVRRVVDDPTYRFEVICGARRHWSVSWLRAHHFPEFKFVVEPRELSDEEAFRVADLENRSRKDLSDLERARDYAVAIDRYYGGSQQKMVERLQVTKSWLSRYLELAKLPSEVLACFETLHVIGITHAAAIAPQLSHPRNRERLLAEASALAAEQRSRPAQGLTPITPSQVVSRLLRVNAQEKSRNRSSRTENILDDSGRVIFRVSIEDRGGISLLIPKMRANQPKVVSEAINRYLERRFMSDR